MEASLAESRVCPAAEVLQSDLGGEAARHFGWERSPIGPAKISKLNGFWVAPGWACGAGKYNLGRVLGPGMLGLRPKPV